MAPGRPLKSIQVRNERQAKENLQQLGLGFRFPLLKMFPDRAFTHPVSKQVLEDRALEQVGQAQSKTHHTADMDREIQWLCRSRELRSARLPLRRLLGSAHEAPQNGDFR